MKEIACSVCGKIYPVAYEWFPWNKKNNRRASSVCRQCDREHRRELRSTAERKQKKHEYYLKNKEHYNKKSKEYYESHKERLFSANAEWKKNHPEKIKEYRKREFEKDPEHVRMRARKWKHDHKEAVNVYTQRRLTRKKNLKSTLTSKQWEIIKKEFNYRCAYCGEKKKLTQEHFIPICNSGEHTTNNIIPACLSCNSKKQSKDFFEWYPTMKFYSKKREKHILDFLKYDNGIQQLEFEEVKMLTETKA